VRFRTGGRRIGLQNFQRIASDAGPALIRRSLFAAAGVVFGREAR